MIISTLVSQVLGWAWTETTFVALVDLIGIVWGSECDIALILALLDFSAAFRTINYGIQLDQGLGTKATALQCFCLCSVDGSRQWWEQAKTEARKNSCLSAEILVLLQWCSSTPTGTGTSCLNSKLNPWPVRGPCSSHSKPGHYLVRLLQNILHLKSAFKGHLEALVGPKCSAHVLVISGQWAQLHQCCGPCRLLIFFEVQFKVLLLIYKTL